LSKKGHDNLKLEFSKYYIDKNRFPKESPTQQTENIRTFGLIEPVH
jgi:hypothetical protein